MKTHDSQALNAALEKWLVGFVRAGQEDGCTGAIMLILFGDRCQLISAAPGDKDELAAQLHRLAEAVKDGDGMPLSTNHGQTIKL